MRTILLLTLLAIVAYFSWPTLKRLSPTAPAIISNLPFVPTPTPTPVPLPPPSIQSLADQATMTAAARLLFYSAQPVIDTDRAVFNQHCQAPVASNTIELGCYTSDNHIYLLNIDNPDLRSQMVVTAAHEMLHAAYDRLLSQTRTKINAELEASLPYLQNKDLTRELRSYQQTEPGERDDELHSIIGTEYPSLDPNLENYYKTYFTDRQKVIADARSFDQAFNQTEAEINSLKKQIQTLREQMNYDLSNGNTNAYNRLVPQVNHLVDQYNADVTKYNQLSRSLNGPESTTQAQ